MRTKQPTCIARRERLGRLADLCPAISAALQHAGLSADVIFLAFRDSISLECVECHTKVSGADLFVLTQPTEGQDLTTTLHRLRLGFCANPGCKSFHCELTFQPDERVDWRACLARAERSVQDLEDSRAGRGRRWRSELVRPTIVAVAALLLLLLVRQLYFGGRIPLVREPEKWRVDPDPAGEAHAR